MNAPHDPNKTIDIPSEPADSLDAGLAAGFGRPAAPRSSLGDMRPVLLKEVEGESSHVIKPKSDAMPPKEQTGDRYRLDGEIARGGMGAVLRGRDVDLGRDLAVKVLLAKHADRPEVARRFIEEAQIGGQLQHPGVVPVYDIGRFGDRPFFTMKLVKGLTLAAILGERTDPAADRPRLLGIALQVAQTLAYAHAKGVIHRDLKPANVMVGAFGEVQVMDWGLAKLLAEGGVADEERSAGRELERPEDVTTIRTVRSSGSAGSFGTDTEAGSLLGTPAYMSPEQANGDIVHLDRRADVFGFGAILCEVLTGKPPYVGRSSEEVRRKACNGDLADALSRLDSCGADAELIALTKACLSPEAIDRPKDAQAVADALTAYLDGVQERLHQAELAEAEAKARAVEEAKRRRLTLALAATVLLAVTLGGGGWLWVKNERDARQAQVTREVNDALNKATALREQAKAANVGGAALLAQAREQAQRALALVENGPADAALADQVRRLQNELNEEEKDRQLIAALEAARLAQAETVVGANRFASERAVPLFRKAFAGYGLPAGQGEPAAVATRIGQRPPAVREGVIAAWEEWIALAADPEHQLAEPHLDWLRAVVAAAEPADNWTREFRTALADKDAGRRRKALEKLAAEVDVRKQTPRTLIRLAWRLDGVEPGEERRHGYAMGPAGLQMLRRAQQQYPADFAINQHLGNGLRLDRSSPAALNEALRYLTVAVALRPDSPGAYLNLGVTLADTGRLDEAIASYRKAIALDPNYAAALTNLAGALAFNGQVDEAIAIALKAIKLTPKHAGAHYNLGVALREKGQLDEAIIRFLKAIELNPKFADAHVGLGLVHWDNGQLEQAIDCYLTAIDLDPRNDKAHANLGAALSANGQVDEAIACWRKAIELNPQDAKSHYNLGNALNGRRQVDEAIACWRKAIEFAPKFTLAHVNLGNALSEKRRLDEAIACYRKAIEIDPKHAPAHSGLGNALYDKRELEEAIASYRKAIALDEKLVNAHYNLGVALGEMGEVIEAIACYRKTIALAPKFALGHHNLGIELNRRGQLDEAIASYREAIKHNSKSPDTHGALGEALLRKGKYVEARDATARALELLPENHPLRALVSRQLTACVGFAKVEERFPLFITGEQQPDSAQESLLVARMCRTKRMYAASARFFTEAFAADPRLANALKAAYRYDAACYAALAAAGQGEDAGKLDAAAKAKLRGQTLGWLKADLAAWSNLLASGPPQARPTIVKTLSHWQKDTDLAGLRDKEAMAKLSAEEQKAFAQLWADVAALLKKAEEKPK